MRKIERKKKSSKDILNPWKSKLIKLNMQSVPSYKPNNTVYNRHITELYLRNDCNVCSVYKELANYFRVSTAFLMLFGINRKNNTVILYKSILHSI